MNTYKLEVIAEKLAISTATVRRLMKSGELKATNIAASGRRPVLRVTDKALDSFLEARQS